MLACLRLIALYYSPIQLLKLAEMSVKNDSNGSYEQISILICKRV